MKNNKLTYSAQSKNLLSRRQFLAATGAAGIMTGSRGFAQNVSNSGVTTDLIIGIVTDLHYADKDTWATRHYRDSLEKLRECVTVFNKSRAAFAIELGDFIDKAEKRIEYGYLDTINDIYKEFDGQRHYVIGNHDVATFSKSEFMRACGSRKNYYSFDLYGWHFVILDANYNKDSSSYMAGNFNWTETYIPEPELKWLAEDLIRAKNKHTVAFVHQNLHNETNEHGVKNAPEVRSILEKAGNVKAVFQGHMHTGGFAEINGINYVTFKAGVEGAGKDSKAYAVANLKKDGHIDIKGYGKQESYSL